MYKWESAEEDYFVALSEARVVNYGKLAEKINPIMCESLVSPYQFDMCPSPR